MNFFDRIKKDFSTVTWVLIPVAIAINIAIGQLVVYLKLPVYLDSIGTIFVAAVAGPWAGALTGALSNIIWGSLVDPNALPWWPVAFFIGLVAGFCANGGLFKSWWKVMITGFAVSLASATSSIPIAIIIYGGITASGSSIITAWLLQHGWNVAQAVTITSYIVEPIDKISTALLAFAIVQGLSSRFLARFPHPENLQGEEGTNRTQLLIAIGVVILLVLILAVGAVKVLGQ